MGKFLVYQQSKWHYWRTGTGPQVVLCLHGFNESGHSFSKLTNPHNHYSIIALDLPFHGQTQWKQGLSFTPDDLLQILRQIQYAEGFRPGNPIEIMGFSLGGRLALAFYQQYPHLVSKLYLIAPDGLQSSFWYRLAVHTQWGNHLFAKTMQQPQWFLKFAHRLHQIKVINPGIHKFVVYYLQDKGIRNRLYQVWTAFRFFNPQIGSIKKRIRQQKTPVELYFGKFDNVIPASRANGFISGIQPFTQVTILQAGHRLLQEKPIQDILR